MSFALTVIGVAKSQIGELNYSCQLFPIFHIYSCSLFFLPYQLLDSFKLQIASFSVPTNS